MVKSTRRRIYRRKRSTLSNYKIATKTSAKAQSKQIYALKRRVNRIYRMNKPEVRIQQRLGAGVALTSDNAGVLQFDSYGTLGATSSIIPYLGGASNADTNSDPINNFARMRSFNLYGHLEYSTLATTSQPVTMRLVIVQTKTTRAQNIGVDDVFASGTGVSSSFQKVYGPLQLGLSRTCKVLSDKRYILSYQRPSVTIRTNLKYLLNYYRDTASDSSSSGSESVAKGTIYIFYACQGSGLAENPALFVNSYKMAFIDN